MTGTSLSSVLHDFVADEETLSLDVEVDLILNNPGLLTQTQLINLAVILKDRMPDGIKYDANFDLMAEVSAQLTMIKAMRNKVMINGMPVDGVTARDLKEVATAANTLFQSILKNHAQMVNMDRLRSIENATITAVRAMDEDFQAKFLEELERQLETIN